MGFPTQATITFICDRQQNLPVASTCALVLRLPLSLIDPVRFAEKMVFAISNTVGFGQV